MTTLVSDPIAYVAHEWEDSCGYDSAVLSGIKPDAAHLDRGGYHCSIEDLIAHGNGGDYSNTRPDDKGFNPKYGAAIDMSMSSSDMIKCHNRVRAVWADRTDPRRIYMNAINTWDGSGDAVRLDFYANTERVASADHKWHNHGEMRRRYLLDWTAARAMVSALKGETKEQWISGGDMSIKTDPDAWAMANRVYAIVQHFTNFSYTLPDGTKRSEVNKLAVVINSITSALAESATREQAMLVAITKLAEGGADVDTAVIVAAVNAAAEKTNAAVAALQADLDASQAENERLKAELAAVLSPSNN